MSWYGARGQPEELRAFAAGAVGHWTGAPIHAHAVAAGFSARAGDLEAARHHVATVVDLGGWRADRSYLWSVFVRELAQAAVALADQDLCAPLLADLEPLAGSCGVNGAVVAFAGSHADTAGLLAAALDQPDAARQLLKQASQTYERLGATGWLADVRRELATTHPLPRVVRRLRLDAPQRRRMADQLQWPARGRPPHQGAGRHRPTPGRSWHRDPRLGSHRRRRPIRSRGALADRHALDAYRKRLADIDDEADEANRHHDDERVARLEAERQALLEEGGRVSGLHGRRRSFANYPAERARKAVAARVRDAIRKLEPLLPDLAAHLQRTIVTGTYCRYHDDRSTTWDVDNSSGDRPTLAT